MPTTRFNTTIEALKGGPEKMPLDKAVANLEGWEEYLSKHDAEGVKKIRQDLGKLKKLLGGKEPDDAAIKKLLAQIGKETVAAAGDDDHAVGKAIRELGEALSKGHK